MSRILSSIFRPQDISRQKVREEVAVSRRSVEKAVNRFDETIRDLMDKNDKLRGMNNGPTSPPSE